MNAYILKFKFWYEQRSTRERGFFIILSWVILYAIFYFLIFKNLEITKTNLVISIKQKKEKINVWQTQINALHRISLTPAYKQWLKQKQTIDNLQNKYNAFLQASKSKKWQEVAKGFIPNQPGIKLEQIKNSPEVFFHSNNILKTKIYQRPILIVYSSNYFDSLKYLEYLEKYLPNVRWQSIDYQVTQYPLAKIQMEFLILYEKPNS